MNAIRCVDMAALEGYTELFSECGHSVRVYVASGNEMRQIRLKAAKHIPQQCKKGKSIPKDAAYQESTAYVDDVSDNGIHYGGIVFVPVASKTYALNGRMSTAADAVHCNGVGPHSYCTYFEVVTYDTNMHLLPLTFKHFVGTKCHDYRKEIFFHCKQIAGFDVPLQNTVVYQKKSLP